MTHFKHNREPILACEHFTTSSCYIGARLMDCHRCCSYLL